MEPISPDTPFHTKYFDVIVFPSPSTSAHNVIHDMNSPQKPSQQAVFNSNSIMFYEDAILDAIKDLKDGHVGSTLPSIRKHIRATYFPHDQEDLEDKRRTKCKDPRGGVGDRDHQHKHHRSRHMHLNNLPFHWYHTDPPHPPTPVTGTPHMSPMWRENLFLQALKSVLDKKCIIGADAAIATDKRDRKPNQNRNRNPNNSTSGCCSSPPIPIVRNGSTYYRLSQEYKRHHTLELACRLRSIQQYKVAQDAKMRRVTAERRERELSHVPPVHLKPIFRKRGLVPSHAVTIVDAAGTGTDSGIENGNSEAAASSTISPSSVHDNNEEKMESEEMSVSTRKRMSEEIARRDRNRSYQMDLVQELQKDKRSALPHRPLHLHADDNAVYELLRGVHCGRMSDAAHHARNAYPTTGDGGTGSDGKTRHPISLREKMKIPRQRILVKEV